MFLEKVAQIWKIKDLRKNILIVLGLLVIFRLVAHVPIPGVNAVALKNFFSSNQLLGLLNIFSGGGLANFSVIMLGVGPYITASIIFQLLVMIIPALEEFSKDEQGRRRINQYTRLLTVPLAAFQAFAMIKILQNAQTGPQRIISADLPLLTLLQIILIVTAGTIFLMWLGEIISERKIGNGISIIIFAGIVTEIPGAVGQILAVFDPTQIFILVGFLIIAFVTVSSVVFITEGQRNIPVSYAKRVRGMRMYGGMDTHLPIRVNQAGMIPIIFAISIILFPSMIAQFFINAKTAWVAAAAQWLIELFQNHLFYGSLYFLLVVGFTYFYTAVVFHPQQIADNLQKQGAFVPGIRPGRTTAEYLNTIVNRIVFTGALFLGCIATLPILLGEVPNAPQNMIISGASLLIVVGVVIDIMQQINSQLTMRDYENF
ncbi:MAG: preprotein translocase subunit SecY [bacterium]